MTRKFRLTMPKKILRARLATQPAASSKLEPEGLKRLVRVVMTTRPDELDCDECFEQLDRFVEATLAGKSAAEAMPLVQDHLGRCGNCREEFETLLNALRALT
jgi:hypothetical protein